MLKWLCQYAIVDLTKENEIFMLVLRSWIVGELQYKAELLSFRYSKNEATFDWRRKIITMLRLLQSFTNIAQENNDVTRVRKGA